MTPAHVELIKVLAAVAVEEFCSEIDTPSPLASSRDHQERLKTGRTSKNDRTPKVR